MQVSGRGIADKLAAFGGLVAGAAVFWQTQSWWKTSVATAGGALLGFAGKVLAKQETRWVDRTDAAVDRLTASVFGRYARRYAEQIYYKHRTFDVKGFSTQGKFALELESVYVDLDVDPAVVGTISQDPIRLPENHTTTSDERNVFFWLAAEPERPRNFAIVGPPGSGKSTLLKHLAQVTASRRGLLNRTPVLLVLRDHAAAIAANPEMTLSAMIQSAWKDPIPPATWLASRLEKGKCLVMFDGLDEVADPALRSTVVRWVERQVESAGANRFVVTSRPNGYRDNPVSGFTVLRVLPFSDRQVETFVRNWYLANELVAHQKDDPGVRMEASQGAEDLLARLRRTPTLQDLAVNPLLLTLIATVHRYRSELPGRRVELFAEICDVFLGKRQSARGMAVELTPAQKVRVLRVLAYEMMQRQAREIPSGDAAAVIEEVLKLVSPGSSPLEFLQAVEDSSGLLATREVGIHGFAHLTFQEYLASVHIKEERLEAQLAAHAGSTWWHETARLFAAQGDATPIVEACLKSDRPELGALMLATDCEAEALELRSDLRVRLRRITEGAIEDSDAARRRLSAEHMLARRSRSMRRIDENHFIDVSPVTNAEYQLFVDDMRTIEKYRVPEHWLTEKFPAGTGLKPVFNIRASDAEEFCDWATKKYLAGLRFTLPLRERLTEVSAEGLSFFAQGEREMPPRLPATTVLHQLVNDMNVLAEAGFHRRMIRASMRIGLLEVWAAQAAIEDYRRRRIKQMIEAVDRTRVLELVSATGLPSERLLIRTSAVEVVQTLEGVLDEDIGRGFSLAASDAELAHACEAARRRDLILTRAREIGRELAQAEDTVGRAAYMLNWLTDAEQRSVKPLKRGLWLARVQRSSAQAARG